MAGARVAGGVRGTPTPTHVPICGQCAGGTHPTGMHSCVI